jgi:hypothetical protein
MTALCRVQPHTGVKPKITTAGSFSSSRGLIGKFGEWGGWGSNPRPADYENSGPMQRALYKHK